MSPTLEVHCNTPDQVYVDMPVAAVLFRELTPGNIVAASLKIAGHTWGTCAEPLNA